MNNSEGKIDWELFNSLVPFHFAQCFLGFVGLLGNLFIMLAVCRSRTLRSMRCSYVIGCLAVADFLFCAMCIQISMMALSSADRVSRRRCFLLLSPGLFGMGISSALVLLAAVDRLLMLVCSQLCGRVSTLGYLTLMLTPALVYASAVVALGATRADESIVWLCMPPTAYESELARPVWLASGVMIGIAVAVVYSISYAILRWQSYGHGATTVILVSVRAEARRRRLLNTLMIVGLVYCATCVFTFSAMLAVEVLKPSARLALLINTWVGITANLNAGCNAFIYAWRNPEWRRALADVCFGRVRPRADERQRAERELRRRSSSIRREALLASADERRRQLNRSSPAFAASNRGMDVQDSRNDARTLSKSPVVCLRQIRQSAH